MTRYSEKTYEHEPPLLRLDRAYPAGDAARMLGMSIRQFNERVRTGWLLPINKAGERRYSGFLIARKLGWPLTDDPSDYLPSPLLRSGDAVPPYRA